MRTHILRHPSEPGPLMIQFANPTLWHFVGSEGEGISRTASPHTKHSTVVYEVSCWRREDTSENIAETFAEHLTTAVAERIVALLNSQESPPDDLFIYMEAMPTITIEGPVFHAWAHTAQCTAKAGGDPTFPEGTECLTLEGVWWPRTPDVSRIKPPMDAEDLLRWARELEGVLIEAFLPTPDAGIPLSGLSTAFDSLGSIEDVLRQMLPLRGQGSLSRSGT